MVANANKPSIPTEIQNLYKPIKTLQQILSLSPQSEDNSWLTKCKQLIIITSLLYVSITAIIDAKSIHPKSTSAILENMDRAAMVFNLILCIIIINNTRKTRYDYLKRIKDFDNAFDIYFQNGVDANDQHEQTKHQLRLFLLHLIVSVLYLLVELSFELYNNNPIHYKVASLIGIMLRAVTVFDFIGILSLVFGRFRMVNHVVLQLILHKRVKSTNKNVVIYLSLANSIHDDAISKPWNGSGGNSVELKRIKDTLTILRLTHESLTMICRDLSEVYGVFNALAILTSLIEQVNQTFSIFIIGLDAAKLSDFECHYGLVKAAMFMYIIGATHFYFVPFHCSAVEDESSATKLLLQDFFLETSYRRELGDNLRLFVLQLRQTDVKFSAAGIFELNWKLMTLIVGEVGSYLIFFIQFSGFTFESDDQSAKSLHALYSCSAMAGK